VLTGIQFRTMGWGGLVFLLALAIALLAAGTGLFRRQVPSSPAPPWPLDPGKSVTRLLPEGQPRS